MKYQKVLLGLSTFLLLGCASGAKFSGLFDIPSNQSIVYLMRVGVYGSLCSSHVYLNEIKTSEIRPQGFDKVVVSPGKYTVSFTEPCGKKRWSTDIVVQSNSEAFVLYRAKIKVYLAMPGQAAGNADQHVLELEKSDALELLPKLKRSRSD